MEGQGKKALEQWKQKGANTSLETARANAYRIADSAAQVHWVLFADLERQEVQRGPRQFQ